MAVPISLGPVHHLRLTVTDVQRSRAFYTELLGFQIAMDAPPPADDPHHDLTVDLLQDGIVMVNGDLLLGLRPAWDPRRVEGSPLFAPPGATRRSDAHADAAVSSRLRAARIAARDKSSPTAVAS